MGKVDAKAAHECTLKAMEQVDAEYMWQIFMKICDAMKYKGGVLMNTTLKNGYMVIINFTNEPYTLQTFYGTLEDAMRKCIECEGLTTFRNWEIIKYEQVAMNILHR